MEALHITITHQSHTYKSYLLKLLKRLEDLKIKPTGITFLFEFSPTMPAHHSTIYYAGHVKA
jgi:hypothetical protein